MTPRRSKQRWSNTLRTHVFALPAFNFTDPILTAGRTVIQALHIRELRAALADAYAAAGQAPPSYTDSTPYIDDHPCAREPRP